MCSSHLMTHLMAWIRYRLRRFLLFRYRRALLQLGHRGHWLRHRLLWICYLGISFAGTAGIATPLGLLSPCRVQPILEETSAVCHIWSLSVSIPAGESPDESDLTGSSSPLAAIVPDVRSSQVVWTSCRSSHRSLSPGSVQSDGSFYSATDSPTGQAPAMRPETTFDPSLCQKGPPPSDWGRQGWLCLPVHDLPGF